MISDERLREAARRAEESILASLPEPEDCEAVFSARFERKMRKLIRRTAHPIRYRVMKAAACFLLVVLIGGGGVLTFSTEARAAFLGWVREVYSFYFEYHYTGSQKELSQDTIYCPTWVPDGYDLIEELKVGTHFVAIYRNEQGETIIFNCSSSSESLVFQIDRKDTQMYPKTVHDMPADLHLAQEEGDTNLLVWEDENIGLIYWIISTLESEKLFKMAESVAKIS